jgi:hypothetical protein
MTSPAANIDQTTLTPMHRIVITGGSSGPSVVVGNFPTLLYKKVRPASGNVAISNGWRPCRAWTHTGHRWTWSCGSCTYDNIQFSTKYVYPDGAFWGGFNAPAVPAFPNSVTNRAEQAALLKLKNQDLNLGQFIAEWKQTSRLLANSASRIAAQVRHYRKKNPKAWHDVTLWQNGNCIRSNWHKIPSSWLELQYGWTPLMSDIYAAALHLARPDRLPLIHVKGYAEDGSDFTTALQSSFHAGSSGKYKFDVSHKAWVSMYYRLSNAQLAEFSSLGLINPVEIVWELLPYSFVVDWFLPVGNWLSSLTADAGFTFQGGSLSKMTEVKASGTKDVIWLTHPTAKASGSVPVVGGKAFNFARSCYSSSPVPGLYFKNPLSATHIANAMALLALAFRGDSRLR